MSLIVTKAALALKNVENNFQVIKYESHKPKKKLVLPENESSTPAQHSKKALDLKTIRHEIVKFGMSGFDKSKKQEAKIALAVSLGAKPPKREYVNYKELMQKRKEEKMKESKERQMMISKTVLQNVNKKKKKNVPHDVGHFLSNYGNVQKKDLKKNNVASKKKKKN